MNATFKNLNIRVRCPELFESKTWPSVGAVPLHPWLVLQAAAEKTKVITNTELMLFFKSFQPPSM